eukprot:m.256660 g.256660  ORF g.256660 m.256660 type:complete len:51 (+) comp40402_c0_seq1:382-534(+)
MVVRFLTLVTKLPFSAAPIANRLGNGSFQGVPHGRPRISILSRKPGLLVV